MTKIGPRDPAVPLPSVGPTAPAGPSAERPAQAPPMNPRRIPADKRPPVLAPTQGDKRTHLGLTSLRLSAQQLAAESAPMESAALALNRVRGHFKPDSAEQVMCDELLDWIDDAASTSPGVTAVSLVLTRFPDYQSQAHGDFKTMARLLDASVQRRAPVDASVMKAVLGFVPVLGTALDFKDLFSALADLREDKDDAAVDVAIAGVAFIPGLDFLKAGKTAAGKQALRAAAEEMPDISREGLRILADKIGPEAAQLAERQVRVFNVARTELIARIDATLPSLTQNLTGLLGKLRGALAEHANPNDVVGAMRDVAGVAVRKLEGGVFDHRRELDTVYDSLTKALDSPELKSHFLINAMHDCRKIIAAMLEAE